MMMNSHVIQANLVDIPNREIYPAKVTVSNGVISAIERISGPCSGYILPGFIDAHVHIESSLLVPSEFARMAVLHGTVATVSDPHEIANVLGIEGVEFMISNAAQVPFHFFFGAPSCVPATVFETAGAALDAGQVGELLKREEIRYLAEMMNFPGVLSGDLEVMRKIAYARQYGKPVDGHAPGLMGETMRKYMDAGISTDHECFRYEEGLEKVQHGVKVIIREGSAARNFNTLIPLMKDHAPMLMFCSDDKHPDSLLVGHINQLVARAVALGYNIFDVLQAACINPVQHYGLPVGQLRVGDPADYIVSSDLETFTGISTYIKGQLVAQSGESFIPRTGAVAVNRFECSSKTIEDFADAPAALQPVIQCLDGELITGRLMLSAAECTPANDVLKLTVVNRYRNAPVATAYVKGFGLTSGAIASSVAHDSHNIIVTGTSDEMICKAVNLIVENRGGLCAVTPDVQKVLPLPVAGLMSDGDAWEVAALYTGLDRMSKEEMGSVLRAPFMSLSFMALLVIPHLKLSDKGLFDGDSFSFVSR
jgi:adenine deaminase